MGRVYGLGCAWSGYVSERPFTVCLSYWHFYVSMTLYRSVSLINICTDPLPSSNVYILLKNSAGLWLEFFVVLIQGAL